jgi:hypothetical protein
MTEDEKDECRLNNKSLIEILVNCGACPFGETEKDRLEREIIKLFEMHFCKVERFIVKD